MSDRTDLNPNVFFFSSRRRHTRCSRDWSSDVCSSDLVLVRVPLGGHEGQICRAVRWCDRHEVAAGKFLRTGVEDQLKAQLLHVEVHAAIQIANENGDGLQA